MDKNATTTTTSSSKPRVDVWNVTSSICTACLDGDYQNCYCNSLIDEGDDGKIKDLVVEKVGHLTGKELSTDSLGICSDFSSSNSPSNQRKYLDSSGSFTNSISGEYISDNEFDEGYLITDNRTLPPPVTDWDTIDSILSDELIPEDHDTSLSSKVSQGSGPVCMQMVFVDSESDKDSVPDVEVYYDDNKDFLSRSSGSCSSERNIESRDSGYVTGDVYELNIEHVTDKAKRKTSLETAEEASRLLASLRLHEELEEKRLREVEEKREEEHKYRMQLQHKSVGELRVLKESLELRVAEVNITLLQELSLRDDLHSQHQALLVNADDIAKANESVEGTNSSTAVPSSPLKKNKRRSFWFR